MNQTRWAILLACAAVYSIGSLIGSLVPDVIAGAMHKYAVNVSQAGLTTLIEGLTAGFLSMALGALSPRISGRTLAAFGLLVNIASNAASYFAPDFTLFVLLRFLAGISDAVLIYVGVSLVATKSTNPVRSYAVINVAANVYGAALLASLPLLSASSTGLAYLLFAAVLGTALIPLLFFLPTRVDGKSSGGAASASLDPSARNLGSPERLFVLILGIVTLISGQTFMMFAFSALIGASLGLSAATINTVLGGATLAAIVGSLAADVVVRRFDRWLPLLVGSAAIVAMNSALMIYRSPILFGLVVPTNLLIGYFFLTALIGWSAEMDTVGKYSAVMMGAFVVATSLTPVVVGVVIDSFGLSALLPVIVLTGIGLIGLCLLARGIPASGQSGFAADHRSYESRA